MKKVKVFLSSAVCIFIALLFALLFSASSVSTVSRYVTTATQYGTVSTVTPYILNEEVKISFLKGDSKVSTQQIALGTSIYCKSLFYNSKKQNYLFLQDSADEDLTNAYGTKVTADNLINFADFYADLKDNDAYGTMTYGGYTYAYPLVLESGVDDVDDTATTVNIAPLNDDVNITIYFATNNTDESLFTYNGKDVYKNDTEDDSYSVTEADSYYTTNVDGKNSGYKLYSFTTKVSKEKSVNILKSDTSNVMIFLIVLTPISPISFTYNGSTESSGTITGNGNRVLTLGFDESLAGAEVSSVAIENSDTSVATAKVDSNTQVTLTAVSVGTTTITITVTASDGKTYKKKYVLTVEDSLTLSGDTTITTVDGTTTLNASLAYEAPSGGSVEYEVTGNTNTKVATTNVSGSKITVTGVSPGSADITVTATVKDSGSNALYTCSGTCTVHVNGYVIQGENGATSVTAEDNLTLSLCSISSGVIGDAVASGVTWSVSDTTYATINSSTGVLTGVSAGTVTVTAMYSGVNYTTEITISKKLNTVTETYTMSSTNNAAITTYDSSGNTYLYIDGTSNTGTLYYAGNNSSGYDSSYEGIYTGDSSSSSSGRYFGINLESYKDDFSNYKISVSVTFTTDSNKRTCYLETSVSKDENSAMAYLEVAKNSSGTLTYDSDTSSLYNLLGTDTELYITFSGKVYVTAVTITLTPIS